MPSKRSRRSKEGRRIGSMTLRQNQIQHGDTDDNPYADDSSDCDSQGMQSEQPGAVRVNGTSGRGNSTTSSTMEGQEEYTDEESSPGPTATLPTLQAELAPNIDTIVAEALRKQVEDTAHADIVAPPIMTKANWLLPSFSKSEESRFQAEHAALLQRILPSMGPFGGSIYLLYYAWDLVQPIGDDSTINIKIASLGIRIAGAMWMMLLVSFAKVYPSTFSLYSQNILLFVFIVGTFGKAFILYLYPDGFVVGIAMVGTCILASCSIGLLQFRFAILYTFACLVISNALMILATDQDLLYVSMSCNSFLVLFCIMGLFASYGLELNLRHRFRETGTIFQWAKKSHSEAFEC